MPLIEAELDLTFPAGLLTRVNDIVRDEQESAARDILTLLEEKLTDSPPAPIPGSRYQRRTPPDNIASNYTHAVATEGGQSIQTTGTLTNRLPEWIWVQLREYQAHIHEGRWSTLEDVIEQYQSQIVARLHQMETRVLDRLATL